MKTISTIKSLLVQLENKTLTTFQKKELEKLLQQIKKKRLSES